jgi:uncharacterized membrane protein
LSNARRNFVAGIVTLLPVVVTIYITYIMVNFIGGGVGKFFKKFPYFDKLPSFVFPVIGLIVVLIAFYITGIFATTYLGKRIINMGEKIIINLPVVRGLYKAAREFSKALFESKTALRKVVLLEFPKEESYAIGFLTTDKVWEIDGEKHYNIFVPTTPNPTSGWYLIVPESRLKFLPFSVEDGMQMVISGGIVISPEKENIFHHELFEEISKTKKKKE